MSSSTHTETPPLERPPTSSLSLRGRAAQALERRTLPYIGIAVPVGLLGAIAVAALVFVADWLVGQPLATPHVLGAKLLLGEDVTFSAPPRLAVVFGYSLVHVAAFVIAAAAAVSTQAVLTRRGVSLRAQAFVGAAAMYVGLQLLFSTLLALIGGLESADFDWFRVAGGNALAAVAMATLLYLRRREITALERGEIK